MRPAWAGAQAHVQVGMAGEQLALQLGRARQQRVGVGMGPNDPRLAVVRQKPFKRVQVLLEDGRIARVEAPDNPVFRPSAAFVGSISAN